MSSSALAGPIRSIPLLADLNEAQLLEVAAISERRMYSAGQPLVVAGDLADGAYYLIDGDVVCETQTLGKTTSTLVPPGSTLLELAMIVEIDASATCTARGTSKVLKLSRQAMHDLMQENACLTDAIMASLTGRLSGMAEVMRDASIPFEATQPTKKASSSRGGENWTPAL